MKRITAHLAGWSVILTAVLWSACTKSTPFGSELLGSDQLEYAFTDTMTVRVTVEHEDSVRTSDRTATQTTFLCGSVDDPIFGKTTADLYTLCRLVDPADRLRSTDVIDSVVMFLRYRPAGVYGDTTQDQTLRIYQVDAGQGISWTRDYYALDQIPASEEIGALENFRPRPNKSDSLFLAASKAPYLRVKMHAAFHDKLLALDSATQATDTLLWKALRGFKITTSAAAAPGAMLAFDLNEANYSRMRVYFHRDTSAQTTDFEFDGGNKFVHFSHDYGASPAGQRIGQANPDYLFVQAGQGLRLKVELPYADRLPSNVVINKAQLELTAVELPGDNKALFPLPGQLILNERLDTSFQPIPDVLYSLGPNSTGGFSLFGGQPEKSLDNGVTVDRYLLTLSEYIQRVVEDPNRNTIYLSVFPQATSIARAVFYGPGSATFRARVTLKVTHI